MRQLTDIPLGIDLGTTDSAIALCGDGGQTRVLPNADGDPTTPSALLFLPDEVLVGTEALKADPAERAGSVYFFVDQLTKPAQTWEFHGRRYRTQDLCALLLRQLLLDAASPNQPLSRGVLSVPSSFGEAEKSLLMQAGQNAGLTRVTLIDQAAATALALGDREIPEGPWMIVDMGGGNTDVTVVRGQGEEIDVLASQRHPHLGGRAWDDALLAMVLERIEEQSDAVSPDLSEELRQPCREAKHILSTLPSVVLPFQFKGDRVALEVTRTDLELRTAPLVEGVRKACTDLLDAMALKWSDLGEVFLVGGAAQMPMVVQALGKETGRPDLLVADPQFSVARGAAIAALRRHGTEEVTLSPPPSAVPAFTTQAIGLVIYDADLKECILPIIPEGASIPTSERGRFAYAYDGMTSVQLEVVEGSGKERAEVRVLGTLVLGELPPRPRGTPIDVIYRYTRNHELQVEFIDVETGLSRSATLSLGEE